MTFEEAYKKTGRVLCITLSATTKKAPPVLINYITAPNVVIGSAVLASAAVPGFIDPMRLQIKDENGVVRYQSKQDEVITPVLQTNWGSHMMASRADTVMFLLFFLLGLQKYRDGSIESVSCLPIEVFSSR